jgi:hypothetical protein
MSHTHPFFRFLSLSSLTLAACLAASGCGGTTGAGNGADGGPANNPIPEGGCAASGPCSLSTVPSTLQLTVSGFVQCTCFNGTFTLTEQPNNGPNPPVWASPPITGCPGQHATAYLKFSETALTSYDSASGDFIVSAELGIGITDQTSDPGSGNSDYAPVTQLSSCSAGSFSVSGGGSQAGNITDFCPGIEDMNMKWSLTQ